MLPAGVANSFQPKLLVQPRRLPLVFTVHSEPGNIQRERIRIKTRGVPPATLSLIFCIPFGLSYRIADVHIVADIYTISDTDTIDDDRIIADSNSSRYLDLLITAVLLIA